MICLRLLISGRVQGVGFRAAMAKKAAAVGGLQGSVRNLADGRVEALLQGSPQAVEELLAWARKGPLLAKVHSVEVQEQPPAEDLPPFRQVR